MPNITPDTPREAFTIAGHEFQIAKPYTEGHALTAGEASALNQVFAENVRNNKAKAVKAAGDTPDMAALQTEIDTYANAYQFGVRALSSGTAVPKDPTAARALTLAKSAVRDAIKKAGHKVSDFTAEDIADRAAKAVAASPKFLEIAARQIADEQSLSVDGQDSAATEAPKAKAQKA